MDPIDLPKQGDDVQTLWRKVEPCVRFVNAMLKLQVVYTRRRKGLDLTDDNATLNLPPSSGAGTTILPNPFDVTISTTGNQVLATFVPGAGNNLAPINVLESVPVPPEIDSYAYLRCLTDGRSVTSCTLVVSADRSAATLPTLNALPSQVDVLLHLIAYNGGSYTPIRTFWPAGNVLLTPQEVLRTSVDTPAPGKLPYNLYYNWSVNSTGFTPSNIYG